MLPHGEDMGLTFFIPSHLLDLPHLLAGLPDPPDDSLTLWLASQALQLASQTSGWPLRPLTGLSDPLAGLSDPPHGLSDPQTNHLAGFGPSDPQTDFSDPQSGFSDCPAGLSDPLANLLIFLLVFQTLYLVSHTLRPTL